MDLTKPINLSNLSLALAKVKSDYEAKIKSVPVFQTYRFECWDDSDGVIKAEAGTFEKLLNTATSYTIVTAYYSANRYDLRAFRSDGIYFVATTTDGAIQILKLHEDNTVTVETVGQSDWNENDPEASGYIKNKPLIDETPTNDSSNLVTSGGIKRYVDEKETACDTEPIQGSTNPITSGAVYTEKQSLQVLISDKAPMSHTHSVYLHVNDDGSSYFDVDVATQTKEAYNELMDRWFISQGAKTATSEELTALCDEWYTISRNGWDGWTTFAQPEVSTVSTGVKGGDNAGMVCIPSTELVANQDDYAGIPQFAIRDCNWHMSDDGDIIIDAIEGISDNFERSNPEKYVGVLQMTMMHYWYEDEESYTHGLTDDLSDTSHENQSPYPEAIKLDGSVRSWVCHGKYMAAIVNDKMTCCSGVIPTGGMSHNTVIGLKNKNGSTYSGGCITDWSFLILMSYIKYASLTQDKINQGSFEYKYSNKALVAETGVNRALLAQAQSANYIVGSTVNIGTSNRNVSQPSRIVTAVEDIVVDGTTYAAIYFDGDPLDITTSTYVATWHWITGWNDTVLGNDGAKGDPSNGKYPAMIQGIEYSVGGCDICTDAFLNLDGTNMKVYVCKDATKQTSGATTSTSGYAARDVSIALPASGGWKYIQKLTYDEDVFFASSIGGGSSSTYTKDAWWPQQRSGESGTRAILLFGYLLTGYPLSGLSCLTSIYKFGSSDWFFLARLSCNGNRGDWVKEE